MIEGVCLLFIHKVDGDLENEKKIRERERSLIFIPETKRGNQSEFSLCSNFFFNLFTLW